MRLRAYYDRFGRRALRRRRHGPAADRAPSSRGAGGLDPAVDTRLGIGFQLGFEDDVAAASRAGREAGARSAGRRCWIAGRAPSAPAVNEFVTGKVVCVGLNYGEHVREGGRARARPAAAVRQVPQRDHRATATPSSAPRAPAPSTSRWSWAS